MTVARLASRAQLGLQAPLVQVEVHLGAGLPVFSIVGLPATAVKESKDRVRSAIANCGFEFPAGRITVNLSPADLPKEGGRFDLPIALGILLASGELRAALPEDCEFYGELALDGRLNPVRGLLLAAAHAAQTGHRIVVPRDNVDEAALAGRAGVAGAAHLLEVCRHLAGREPLAFVHESRVGAAASAASAADLADVRGQWRARRALAIAAAGSHSLLLVGPPGSGKSMLAQRLPGLLPPLPPEEAFEVATLASLGPAGFDARTFGQRPFRSPHHTASAHAVVGGGAHARPGEISLAHRGVLFLDELPEFDRRVLEALREPLETGVVAVARAGMRAEYPAAFQLVAAMNPCPCGYFGDTAVECRCSRTQVERYRSRISGPLLDRIDLHLEVPRQDYAALAGAPPDGEDTAAVAERVGAARERQRRRQGCLNARLVTRELDRVVAASPDALRVLALAASRLNLSGRACHRILRVARTIADLAGADAVAMSHVAEAVDYRRTMLQERAPATAAAMPLQRAAPSQAAVAGDGAAAVVPAKAGHAARHANAGAVADTARAANENAAG